MSRLISISFFLGTLHRTLHLVAIPSMFSVVIVEGWLL